MNLAPAEPSRIFTVQRVITTHTRETNRRLLFLLAMLFFLISPTVFLQAEDTTPLIEEGEPTRFMILGDQVTVEEAQQYAQQYDAVARAAKRPSPSASSNEVAPAYLKQLVADLQFINTSKKSWDIIVLPRGRQSLLLALAQMGDGGLSQASGKIQLVGVPDAAADPELEQAVAKASSKQFHITRITGQGSVQAEWGTLDSQVLAELEKRMANDSTFAAARARILPQLSPKAMFEESQLQGIVHADFLNGLILHYLIEHPEVKMPEGTLFAGRSPNQYISPKLLAEWKVTEEDVFRTAMANINDEKRTPTYTEHKNKDGASTILAIHTDDGFAAARLCSIGLMGMWAQQLQDDLVIAIPTKEHLYAVQSSDKAGVASIKELAAKQFATEGRNLTDRLFMFHGREGTITAFSEKEEHAPSPRYVFLPNGPVHGGPIAKLHGTRKPRKP